MCPGEWAQRDISQTGGEAECTGVERGGEDGARERGAAAGEKGMRRRGERRWGRRRGGGR